jgi:uncharacterized membrane protein
VAGAILAGWALKRRDQAGGTAALGAAVLLYRGMTGHCHVYDAIGVDHGSNDGTARVADRYSDTRRRLGGARGIHVDESVTINKPIAEVYRFWRNFENLPTFMQHLDAVAVRDEGISHWVAKGPAGTRVEWDARIINEVDNQVIGWQSLEGATVATAGSVNFDETDHGTLVRVHLQYDPPAGRLGALVARLFGEEPNQTIREDLRRFKRLLETGEIPTTDGQPTGRRTMVMHPSARSQRAHREPQLRRAGAGR